MRAHRLTSLHALDQPREQLELEVRPQLGPLALREGARDVFPHRRVALAVGLVEGLALLEVDHHAQVHVQVAGPAEREQRVAQRLHPLVPAVDAVVVWDEDAQQCAVQLARLLGGGCS